MMSKFILLGLVCGLVSAVEKPGDDPLQWLRDSIPGEPGVDYPIFSSVQETGFSCDGRVFGGYYADVDMGCQAYHVCLLDPHGGGMYPTSFLCPNGTLFQQQIFNCDWWYNVDCAASESYYGLAEAAFGNPNGGNNNGGGQCPNANPLTDAECSGVVSNCWSPGQSDTDCPNYGLCCFDGCANRCVDGPPAEIDIGSQSVQQTTYRPAPIQTTPRNTTPRPRPTQRPTTTPGYNYPVPEVTLPIRPVTTLPPVTQPATLYGAPPRNGRNSRRGRRGRRLRRRKVQKRLVDQDQEQQSQWALDKNGNFVQL